MKSGKDRLRRRLKLTEDPHNARRALQHVYAHTDALPLRTVRDALRGGD
jgi:hypothetical protein